MTFFRYAWVLVIVPIFFCVYLTVQIALVRLGEQIEVTEEDNSLFEFASRISIWNIPDLHVAQARYNRERAVLTEDEGLRRRWLTQSQELWDKASDLRPLWPYYQLGALDAEVLLGRDDASLQARFDRVTSLSANERGADRSLFELGFAIWHKLRRDQQDWLVDRIVSSVWPKTVKFALKSAELHDVKGIVCVRLPWNLAQKYCKQKGRWPKQLQSIF